MRYRISRADTLASVIPGERRYDEICADHAREVLRKWVQDQENQQSAAKKLGVDQGTISRNLNPKNQPTLKILIPLSRAMNWTLDQIFGLTPPPPPPPIIRISDSEVNRVADRLADRIARKLTPPQGTPVPPMLPPGPPPRSGKKSR